MLVIAVNNVSNGYHNVKHYRDQTHLEYFTSHYLMETCKFPFLEILTDLDGLDVISMPFNWDQLCAFLYTVHVYELNPDQGP